MRLLKPNTVTMKNAFFLFSAAIILSCNNQTNVEEVNTVTGKYVTERTFPVASMNNNNTMMGIFRDTVEITRGEGDYDVIQSGTQFTPQSDGDTVENRKIQPRLTAKYDEQEKALVSPRTTIHFLDGGDQFYMGKDTGYKYSRIE